MAVYNSFHNEQILKLDVKQQQPNKIPRFVQYDSALLKIELYDNGKLYDVSRAQEFTVSLKRPDGKMVSGLAKYDGKFINYKLTKKDLEVLGEVDARLQVYEGRNRLSSLSFRYDVYEDYEAVGDIDEQTLLSELFNKLWDALTEAQRQGGYAEQRGNYANKSGDYAMNAGDSQKMRWLKWVKTISERNSTYRNPRNGDTVYVVNVSDKNGGAVYRYNSIQSPAKWEEIAGWDTSIIQDIYNLIGNLDDTKETKVRVKSMIDSLNKKLDETRFGGRNLLKKTNINETSNDNIYRPIVSSTDVTMVTANDRRMVQARQMPNQSNTYFGVAVGNSTRERFSVKEGEQFTLSFEGTKSLTATDFTYVYLMRTDGSNRKMLMTQSYPIDSKGVMKYEFTVTAPWDSEEAYVLIGSNKRDGYEGQAFWIRFNNVKLEKGNRATDWSPAFEDLISNAEDMVKELEKDMDGNFTKHNSRITQLENKITMNVTETKYNSKMQAIERWQSDYEQTAREISTTVSHKVGNNEIISRINQSAESISIQANKISLGNGDVVIENNRARIKNIDFNNASATGGSGSSTLALDGDEIQLRGRYTRTWRNKIERNNDVLTRLRLGHLRFRNNTLNRSLYYSDFGISTYVDGDGLGDSVSSGTINFFDTEYSTARGVTMESNMGVVALRSNENRVLLDAYHTVNINSHASSIYFRPMEGTRAGTNEFRMWVKDNPSGAETDGVLSYGNIASNGRNGAGIRFSKNLDANMVYITNTNGDIGTGNLRANTFIGDIVAPSSYVYAVGERMRIIKNSSNRSGRYGELQAGDLLVDSIRTNDANTNFYIGVSSNELRVTNNLMYNGGNVGYQNVRAKDYYGRAFIENSTEALKTNIVPWDKKVLPEIKKGLQLYEYNYKADLEEGITRTRHGLVVERETPEDFISDNKDGVINYEMISWALKGVQEVALENDELKESNKNLQQDIAELQEQMASMQAMINQIIK